MKILIQNGRVIDPASGLDQTCDIAIAAARVLQAEARAIEAAFLKAYRWQYIHSGAQHPHFGKVLSSLTTEGQGERIQAALATLQ